MTLIKNQDRDAQSRVLYSRNHPQIKRLRALHHRAERDQAGLFLIEGMRSLSQAAEQGAKIETLFVVPELMTHPFAISLVRRLRHAGTPCLRLTPEVYYSVTQAEEPQGIGAVVRQKWERLDTITPSRGLCWIAVESVQSAGNLGTIIRTCEAVGGAGLILIGENADPYDPATVRASMGALFSQQLVRTSLEKFAAWKTRRQCTLVGTSPSAEQEYDAIAYPSETILLMGSEKRGLSDAIQELCDVRVKIPMVGTSDSLNVAVATSVLLYEVFRQRREKSG
jgi:RNA methyltransferase, TrmH family